MTMEGKSVNQSRLFLAGIGMITPAGGNVPLTAAAVKAGVNVYSESRFFNRRGRPIIMARVPLEVFTTLDLEIDYGQHNGNAQYDRIIKMAVIAINEACEGYNVEQPVPLLLAMPEPAAQVDFLTPSVFTNNLAQHCPSWVGAKINRGFHSGRAAGLEALDFAYRYLDDSYHDFILLGGSDSFGHYSRLEPLDDMARLLSTGSQDSFAPGEAAAFLLLTRYPDKALVKDGYMISLCYPGLAHEPGHLYSEEAYRGEALDRAFKNLFQAVSVRLSISRIYSSMNGERHWAKEHGVAYLRNREAFAESLETVHPADVYGDLGAATAPALVALAATDLWSSTGSGRYLVYSSSDYGLRGAVLLEKIRAINGSVRENEP